VSSVRCCYCVTCRPLNADGVYDALTSFWSGRSTASEEFLELVKSSLLAALEGFLLEPLPHNDPLRMIMLYLGHI
jgi:hypothetical protein